jgi:hypothetical protein
MNVVTERSLNAAIGKLSIENCQGHAGCATRSGTRPQRRCAIRPIGAVLQLLLEAQRVAFEVGKDALARGLYRFPRITIVGQLLEGNAYGRCAECRPFAPPSDTNRLNRRLLRSVACSAPMRSEGADVGLSRMGEHPELAVRGFDRRSGRPVEPRHLSRSPRHPIHRELVV